MGQRKVGNCTECTALWQSFRDLCKTVSQRSIRLQHSKVSSTEPIQPDRRRISFKFRDSRPIETESANQFLTRITAYMDRWTEMANVRDFESLKRLIIREQFLNVCPKKLAVHLTERPHEDVESMVMQADRYLEAHRQKLSMDNCNKADNEDKRDKHMRVEQRQHKECSNCKRVGHTIEQCRHRGGGNEQICTSVICMATR